MMHDVADVAKPKRPLPTPSDSRPAVKKAKSEQHDGKVDYRTPPPLPLTAAHGVERIPLPTSLDVNRLSSLYLENLARERTEFLRRQDRHVVSLPMVFNDGIVLNWVRRKADSVDRGRSDEANGISSIIHHDDAVARFAHDYTNPRVPPISTLGSGASAADAIVIDSDEDITIPGLASHSRPDVPRGLPNTRAASPSQGAIIIDSSGSDSDTDLLHPVHSENKVQDDPGSTYLPLPLIPSLANVSGVVPEPPPKPMSTREDAATLSRHCPNYTNSSSSDSETEVNITEHIPSGRISVGHAKPSLPSLKPIRQLLASRQQRGGPDSDVLPRGAVISPGISQKPARKEFLEEAPAITSSASDEGLGCRSSDPQLKRVPLPKTDHGRARRLLIPESDDLPLVAVTMRGDCHFIERKKKFRITGYSLPNPGVFRHVEDVCMVGSTAVLGCDGGVHQISFLSIAGRPHMIDVACSPHSTGPRYEDSKQRRGVSRLAAIHAEDGHIKFLSGGYDGTIHKWMADVEKPNGACARKVVSHGSHIMALAYRNRDRSVLSSARGRLCVTDLTRLITVTHPFSDVVQQIHTHPQASYVTLLEVRHLDRQIQLYDSRKGNFDREPCMSFGHRSAGGRFPGSHTRGSVHLVQFARANEDGNVFLWDFRNGKRAVVERRFQQAEKAVHTVFTDCDIATFAREAVTFFEDYLT